MNQKQAGLDNTLATVKQSFEVLKRHGWGILIASILLGGAGIVGVSLMPNVYHATTTILVDPQKIPERYVTSTVTSDPNERLNTLTQQVLSATRLQEIINQGNLYPELRKRKSPEEVLDYMRAKIKIELKQGSEQGLGSFSITYEDADRKIVAPVANQLAASFIDWNLKLRTQQALGTTQFLSSELEQAKQGLVDQEAKLQAFRTQHAGETPDQLGGNLQVLSRLQAELQSVMDAMSRQDEERILLTQTKTPIIAREGGELSERGHLLQEKGRLENELWNLKRQYTDTYPDVVTVKEELKQVDTKLAALPAPAPGSTDAYDSNTRVRLNIINSEMERLKKEEASIHQQIAAYQSKVDAVPVLETQLSELTRDYDASRQNYQSLLDKTFSAGMAEDLERKQQAERFRILDPATTPEKPFKPRRLPMMAVAVLFSFLLSAGVVVGLDLIKGSIKSENDLKALLPAGVKILGTIPPIPSKADIQRKRLVAIQSTAFAVVAILSLILFLLRTRPIL